MQKPSELRLLPWESGALSSVRGGKGKTSDHEQSGSRPSSFCSQSSCSAARSCRTALGRVPKANRTLSALEPPTIPKPPDPKRPLQDGWEMLKGHSVRTVWWAWIRMSHRGPAGHPEACCCCHHSMTRKAGMSPACNDQILLDPGDKWLLGGKVTSQRPGHFVFQQTASTGRGDSLVSGAGPGSEPGCPRPGLAPPPAGRAPCCL